MRDPIIRTLSDACRCLKKCLDANVDIDRQQVDNLIEKLSDMKKKFMIEKMSVDAATTWQPRGNHVATTKENENEKENIPPTPPIREKEKEKENSLSLMRARARVADPDDALTIDESRLLRRSGSCNLSDHELLTQYQTDIPTMERVKKHFALCHPEETDTAFIDEWYTEMDATAWRNPKSGKNLHWPASLEAWFKNKAVMKAIRDPERISDVRKFKGKSGSGGVFHATNYIPFDGGKDFLDAD